MLSGNRREALVEADRSAADVMWSSGFGESVRRSFDSNAVVLVPGARVLTAGRLIQEGGGAQASRRQLTLNPLGLRISADSAIGVTWGVGLAIQDTSLPVFGRYVAVWRHSTAGWRIEAFMLGGIAPQLGKDPGHFARAVPERSPADAAGPFFSADREFAKAAAAGGAGPAFRKWAAPDANIFGHRGFLITGAETIGKAMDGPASWVWDPVAGGGSAAGIFTI
jgi:hypothetical protein